MTAWQHGDIFIFIRNIYIRVEKRLQLHVAGVVLVLVGRISGGAGLGGRCWWIGGDGGLGGGYWEIGSDGGGWSSSYHFLGHFY